MQHARYYGGMATVIDQEEVKAAIGANVIRLRSVHGWSQDELATRVGMSRAQVNRIEKGHCEPKSTVLFSIADAFGVPADVLRAVCENS